MTRALAAALFAGLVLIPAAGTQGIKEGGTFRIAVAIGGANPIDPALVFPDAPLLDPRCGRLIGFLDKPLPAGFTLAPDLAEAMPVVSRDRRTYTFTIRKDARFSDGKRVTARAFAHALERIFTPAMDTGGGDFSDIVRAKKMLDGKATTLAGAVAKGRTLTLRLTRRASDFLLRMTYLCAVPPNLAADPEGAKAPLHSPAPYYAAQHVPGERTVLERNRFYRGERPHRVERFIAETRPGSTVDAVASGSADFSVGTASEDADRNDELVRRYGVNKSQFWVTSGFGMRLFYLNTSQPLFKNNPKLRQAVNFAIDRRKLTRELGAYVGEATDQYLLPVMPGFRDVDIYPLKGPNLKKAKQLAKGHTRSGKVVLYTPNFPLPLATAAIVQRNLEAIDLKVEIVSFPPPVYAQKVNTPGEPFDMGYAGYGAALVRDPSFLGWLFDGRDIGLNGNISYFDSPKYNQLFERASRLTGPERYRAYADLDVQLSRDAAPGIPWANLNATTFVSAKVGCIVLNPSLDLTAVCLK